MPLSEKQIDSIVNEMIEAETNNTLAPSIPPRYPDFTIDEAYKVQMRYQERKIKAGEKVIGKKAGLTSKVMQERSGATEPDFGFITDKMVVPEGDPIDLSKLQRPGFDGAEIAFLMKEDLQGPGVNVAMALEATAAVLPCIEITASRISRPPDGTEKKSRFAQSVADNGHAGRFVFGGKLTPIENIDLRLVGMMLELNGEVVGTAAGAAVLGNPARVVAWLANKLAELGTKLHAGEIVVTGTMVGGIKPKAGDVFKVTFDRIGAVTAIMAK
jgi:2-keto-4-pentenoate hydratase